MRLRPVLLALFAVFALAHSEARAQVLPPPRVLPPAPIPMYGGVLPPAGRPLPTLPLAASPIPVPGYQPSAYQVWQNYGVTYNGWLRPRIVQTPYHGYGVWLYNGAPYPYVYTWPGRHMPSVAPVGAPTP
jgi:hypothetical protein